MNPILKWAGGKRRLLADILPLVPEFRRYIEPFIGGGAVLFALSPESAIISDKNSDLIGIYQTLSTNREGVIDWLDFHQREHNRSGLTHYYLTRELDQKPDYLDRPEEERAARWIYLNRAGFNGLWRVNQNGHFNVPYGHSETLKLPNAENLAQVSEYLRQPGIQLIAQDFEKTIDLAQAGDFLYLDPPYAPISKSSNFTQYTKGGYNLPDRIRLRKALDRASRRGARFILSESLTQENTLIYRGYSMIEVKCNRAINSKGDRRQKVKEILVFNFWDGKARYRAVQKPSVEIRALPSETAAIDLSPLFQNSRELGKA